MLLAEVRDWFTRTTVGDWNISHSAE